MRNLFFKIFLWFWAGLFLVGLAGVLTSMWAANHGFERSWRQRLGSMVRLTIRSLEAGVEREGPQALPAAAERLQKEEGIGVWVFGPGGEELAHPGDSPPEVIQDLAAGRRRVREEMRRSRHRPPRFIRWKGRLLMTHPLRMEGSRPLMVVLALPPRPPLARLVGTRTLVIRLLAVLLIATALCWALARYLTAPVRSLRNATAALASGDLDVRVGPSLGRRRDEIADLARDFDRMAGRLQEMIESRERLLRDVSHELRSPLTRLSVALELARKGEGPEVEESLDRIQREADRLNELIGRLLTLTRLENAAVQAGREVDLTGLLREVAADAGFEGAGRDVRVELHCEGNAVVRGEPGLLRSALENVVRNAVRFTSPGSAVELGVGPAEGRVLVRVRDHGPGVPEDLLPRLFEPFYRVESARERGAGGSGLGLAIARRAVESHGGRISARNHPDGGLEVLMELPAAAAVGNLRSQGRAKGGR